MRQNKKIYKRITTSPHVLSFLCLLTIFKIIIKLPRLRYFILYFFTEFFHSRDNPPFLFLFQTKKTTQDAQRSHKNRDKLYKFYFFFFTSTKKTNCFHVATLAMFLLVLFSVQNKNNLLVFRLVVYMFLDNYFSATMVGKHKENGRKEQFHSLNITIGPHKKLFFIFSKFLSFSLFLKHYYFSSSHCFCWFFPLFSVLVCDVALSSWKKNPILGAKINILRSYYKSNKILCAHEQNNKYNIFYTRRNTHTHKHIHEELDGYFGMKIHYCTHAMFGCATTLLLKAPCVFFMYSSSSTLHQYSFSFSRYLKKEKKEREKWKAMKIFFFSALFFFLFFFSHQVRIMWAIRTSSILLYIFIYTICIGRRGKRDIDVCWCWYIYIFFGGGDGGTTPRRIYIERAKENRIMVPEGVLVTTGEKAHKYHKKKTHHQKHVEKEERKEHTYNITNTHKIPCSLS